MASSVYAEKPGKTWLGHYANHVPEELPPGESGEFAARGPIIFCEHRNKPEETGRAFHEGFFLTGDVAVMDEDGYFYIVERRKDVINVSGYKVRPREVAVVGAPDDCRGETVRTFVAVKDGESVSEEALISHCKSAMAVCEYLRSEEFLAEVPKTATGKFLRRELREGSG